MVIYTSQPLQVPAMGIPLPTATHALRRITKPEAQMLVDRFQPRLLDYRLKNYQNVANSQFDVPGFCPEVRQVARVLGAALEGSASLQASITDTLRDLNEQRKGDRSQTAAAAVLEALLAVCHGQAPGAYVGAICDLANGFLEDRDETARLSPKAVGEILRHELGLAARRRPLGYELALDVGTQRRVHHLAIAHDVLELVAGCPRCQEMLGTIREPVGVGREAAKTSS